MSRERKKEERQTEQTNYLIESKEAKRINAPLKGVKRVQNAQAQKIRRFMFVFA